MTHFLYALPRLIFLTAPLIYLVLGKVNVPGYWADILAYAFPHLVLSSLTNSRIQGQHRHSFWNEIYETVLSPYIFLPTMLALINPKLGSFNVTAKGGVVNRSFFDTRIAQPFLLMLLLNFSGILMGIPRYFYIPVWPLSIAYDGTHPGTILMNLLWTVFNIVVLGVATAVALESQQRRQTVRVQMNVPTDVVLADGTVVRGATSDLSTGGVQIDMDRTFAAQAGDSIQLVFPVLDGEATLPATVIRASERNLRAQFDSLNLQEEEALTMVLYSRADTWLGWGEERESDRPLKSLGRILRLSLHGLNITVRGLMTTTKKSSPKGRLAASAAPLLLLAILATTWTSTAFGAQVATTPPLAAPPAVASPSPNPLSPGIDRGVRAHPVPPGNFDNTFSLADVGVPDTIVLRGVDAYHTVPFSVPQTEVIHTATMHLRYHFSPGLLPSISHLKVSLNGTLFATLPVATRPVSLSSDLNPEEKTAASQMLNVTRNETNALLEATLTLPADMLVHQNELTFEFIGHYTFQCEDPSHSTLWSHVDTSSTIELAGSLLPLHNDLSLLPLPFYDSAVNLHPSISLVFLSPPSPRSLRAAGIVASYFGILTDYRPVHFQVSYGTIPPGNAIVLGENAADLPAALNVTSSTGPTIAMRTNPVDPYSKLLVLTGDSADDLVTASEVLVLQRDLLQGDQERGVLKPGSLADRAPDDAPRWLSTERTTTLGDIASSGDIEGDGSVPVGIYMRVPPDLCLQQCGTLQNLSYHMAYRYNGVPLANESTLQVYMNSAYVSSTPMPHTEKASAVLDTIVPVPVVDMRPFSNSLMMKFVFQIAKKGRCQDTAPLNLHGAILKNSYLDIDGIPHLAVLPNLEIFANAGYPFTRKADLSDTSVVLPDVPTVDEIEMYLTFMGHFGAQTGYPVLNVDVTNAAGMQKGSGKDYLVLGTVDDQPAIQTLNPSLPVKVDGAGLRIQDTQGFFAPLQHAWWKVRSSDHIQSGQLETAGGLPDALIEGIEWPSGSSKSVVVVALRDHSVISRFVDTFLKDSQSSDISQSVSVLHDKRFVSYRIGNDVYKVGSLSLWLKLNLLFSEFPWLIPLTTVAVCILMAALIRAALRRKARVRLQGSN